MADIARLLLAITVCVSSAGCRSGPQGYTVVRTIPHDTAAYTQGLLLADGVLYESTGLYGHSTLRRVDPATGQVLALVRLPDDRFGEGLALHGGRLIQLTWQSEVGYVYDAATLARTDSFSYRGEGWGLVSDGARLIMTDGSATLRFLDPVTFTVQRELTVRDGTTPLAQLNELELVGGDLLANVYGSEWIVRIDTASGQVTGWLDLAGLLPEAQRRMSTDVMNGIAHDPRTGHLLITGKKWPLMFELRVDSAAFRRRGS